MRSDHDHAGPEPARNAAPSQSQRRIRSYALRQGRLTAAQRKALDDLWPCYGIEPDCAFDPSAAFGREAPVVVEIGFGNGESLAQSAASSPDTDFLGIEVHRPGVGHLLLRLSRDGISNVRVYCADAVEVLSNNIADHSLAGINLFFPDPWPKQRHHKRRLVGPDFIDLAARKLARGGIFHAATDWEDYAQQMMGVLLNCEEMKSTLAEGAFAPRPAHRPRTKFESRGERLGHEVWDLIFVRR
jgi:tRNA (guanine-N7-)-methyltransferase